MVWTLDSGELHVTLTKAERHQLWEQFAVVPEVQRDERGEVIPETVPAALSSRDRMERFQEMVRGDDGHQACYDDLDSKSKQLVDAMRKFEHARATGDPD